MNGQQPLNGLQFKDYFLLHHQIYLVAAIERNTFVENWKINLPLEGKASEVQFVAQAFFVCGLEQSWSKKSMNFNRPSNDGSGERVFLPKVFSVSLCLCGENCH